MDEKESMIKGISQIEIAVPNLDEISNWLKLFSSSKKEKYTSEEQGVNAIVLKNEFCDIEFLEPLNDSSPISSFLKKNSKGGIHHICFLVDDLQSNLKFLKDQGVRNITRKAIKGIVNESPVAFLNPKDLTNVLVEFEEIKKN